MRLACIACTGGCPTAEVKSVAVWADGRSRWCGHERLAFVFMRMMGDGRVGESKQAEQVC